MPPAPGVPQRSPLLGPAYTSRSPVLALDQCINLYPEIVERETPRGTVKEVGALYGCPGLTTPVITLGTGPIRGMLPAGLFLYVVAGNTLYRLSGSPLSATTLGTLGSASGPVQMAANANQIGVVDNTSNIYVWDGGTFHTVALPSSANANAMTSLNGFALVNQDFTQTMWQSNYNDFTTWNALNFANADATGDLIIGFATLHNQVYVFKEYHIEVWPNAGVAGFSFQRIPGVLPEVGAVTPYAIAKAADSLIWLGKDANGVIGVFRIRGYEPQRVSTFALEQLIVGYNAAAAFGFAYTQAGHDFYLLTFPSDGVTWCLDITSSDKAGAPMWHQRAGWNVLSQTFGVFAGCCSAVYGTGLPVLVGDSQNGNIYKLDLNTYTDDGSPRRWLRSWRERPNFDLATFRVNCLEIEYDSAGAAGTYTLRQSFDGGQSYNPNVLTMAFGGTTQTRTKFNRLGMTRRGAQSDRWFELSSTDAVKAALLGAWVS